MTRETDLAWAAGIVDGEGCISLHTVKSAGGPCYVIRLSITNTSVLLLDRIQQIFPGGTMCPQKKYEAHHKQRWIWQVCSKKAETVLRELRPYLVNKQRECDLALLSRKYMNAHGSNTKNHNAEELAWLKTQLSDLKKEA